MGQYYKAFVMNEEGEYIFNPLDNDSGLKLMEHSYTGNTFVNGVVETIENEPSRVAWVGDYANEDTDFDDLYTKLVYENIWVKGNDSAFNKTPEVHLDGYLINHSKCKYIDLKTYIEYNKEDGWCVHPLPLLTAIGNGRGGGDYRGFNDYQVGAWAMDLIEYTHEKPESYHEVLTLFDPNA